MKIRTKTLAILGITFFCLFVLLTITTGEIIEKSFNQLEEKEITKNVERVSATIDSHINSLDATANDWGPWDDTYYFLLGENEEYVNDNLAIDVMANLQVDMMLYYDIAGQLYYATGADFDAYETKDVSTSVLEQIGSNDALFSGPSNPAYTKGIISTPEGALLIASTPVTKSTDYEAIAGTLVVARYINQAFLEELEEKNKLNIDLKNFESDGEMQDLGLSTLSRENKLVNIEYLNENSVVGTTVLTDINGKNALTIEVEMQREIHHQGQSAVAYLSYVIIFLGFVYAMILMISLEKYVLSRLSVLSSNLTAITENGSLASRVTMSGDDELYDLSTNINHMLETLEDNENIMQQEEVRSKQRLESILENIISGVLIIDAETHIITDVNPVAEEMFGQPRDKIVGNLCHEFICPAEKGKCPISDLGETVNQSERLLINSKGEKIQILKSVATVVLADRKYLVESFVDLSKIKEAENNLIQAKIEAESASRAKTDFLATMSHELRTPLNSIIGFSDLMLDIKADEMDEKQEKYLKNISTSGKHLLSLINNVLDISKIEAEKIDLHLELISADEVLGEVKQLMVPLASKKEININYSKDETVTTMYADKVRLKQILYNLISNAIKFTPDGGTVDVTVEMTENMARFSVKDTGIGISKEDTSRLFQPFTQLDSAVNRKYEGSGLGLALVKRYVELHKGRIWVESEPGKGTIFTFELPLEKTD